MLLVFILAVICEGVIQIGLLTSSYTPQSVVNNLASNMLGVTSKIEKTLDLPSKIEILWVNIDLVQKNDESEWEIPSHFLDKSVQSILDVTFSVRFSSFLADSCNSLGILHIVINRPIDTLEDEVPFPNTLFVETSYVAQASVITQLLKNYGWKNLGIVQDQEINNSQMSATLKALIEWPMQVNDQVIVDESDINDSESIAYRFQSTTKDANARVLVVMAKPSIASQVLLAADQSVMGGAGYAWILNSDAMVYIGSVLKNSNADVNYEILGVSNTGALGLMATDAEFQQEEPLSSYLSILTLISQAYLAMGSPNGTQIYEYLLTNPSTPTLTYPLHFDSNGIKISQYNLYNIVNFAAIQVGYWDNNANQFVMDASKSIKWPGFSANVPNDEIPIIQLALLYPGHDNSGNVLDEGVQVRNGFDLAISEINASPSILGGYYIQAFYVDTFLLPQLATAYLMTMAHYNILGYVGPASLELVVAYAEAESTKSDIKPIVTYAASESVLSNNIVYPGVLQMIQPDSLQAVALTLFIQLQGWSTIGVIYTDDTFGQDVYSSFLANIGTLEVTILNDPSLRAISYSLNNDGSVSDNTKSSIDTCLREIIRNQIKIIVYLGNPNLTPELARIGSLKKLYGQDYAWIGPIWLTDEVLSDISNNYNSSKAEIFQVLNGAIGIQYQNALGMIGSAFGSKYYEKYSVNYTVESMLVYDTVYTYANVINGMITQGNDYNSGTELMDSLRSVDLTGASGKIKFSDGSNGRSAYGFNIINVQNQQLVTVQVYDPLSANLFTSYNNRSIVWGGGATSPPSATWSSAYDCPFPENMSKISIGGVGIIIAIGSFLCVSTLLLSFFSFNKWKQIEFKVLRSQVQRSWKDTLVQAQIAIEFFQFIAIAPTFSSLEIVISAGANVFMLDIMKVAQTSKADYWILLSVVCGLCYIWFILVVLIMCKAEVSLKKVPFVKRILSILNSVFLPFFGNTMFLPALALLLDMFVCDHQSQETPYVFRDCYTACWQGKHVTYIIMTSIAIICYEPIAAYSRPLWQEARTNLNLKIQPFFLLLKTCVQILLIAIGKSLQSISQLGHGIVYTILISIFTFAMYKIQPFNYHRCNLWEFASLLAVTYLSFLATLSNAANPTHVGWFIALMVGWGIIVIVSLAYQRKKMPNLLIPGVEGKYKPKNNKILPGFSSIGEKYQSDLDESSIPKSLGYSGLNISGPIDKSDIGNADNRDEEGEDDENEENENNEEVNISIEK